MQASEVFANIRDISAQFAAERRLRQQRRELAAARGRMYIVIRSKAGAALG